MKETMPQEIEVRYILPAIRSEFARILIQEQNLSQKEAANVLGLTEAAISQYIHSKRGSEVVFSANVVNEIRKSADKVLTDKNNKHRLMGELFRIPNLLQERRILSALHPLN